MRHQCDVCPARDAKWRMPGDAGLFTLDLQAIWPDVDLKSFRLFSVLIKIVAKHADRDNQSADNEKEDVAIGEHGYSIGDAVVQFRQ